MYPPRVRAHSWGLGLGLGSRGYLGLLGLRFKLPVVGFRL